MICIIITVSCVNAENVTSDTDSISTANQPVNNDNNILETSTQDNENSNSSSSIGSSTVGDNSSDNVMENVSNVNNITQDNIITDYINSSEDLFNKIKLLNDVQSPENHVFLLGNMTYSGYDNMLSNENINLTIIGNNSVFSNGTFYIGSNVSVSLSNLIFNNASQNHDSALINYGSLFINNCTFVNNSLMWINENNNSDGFGSCIDNEVTCIVENSTFYNNMARSGGTIFNRDSLEVKNCKFYNNHANTTGGVVFSWSDIYLTDNEFVNNSAEDGAIIYSYNGTSYVINNTIESNSAIWAVISNTCTNDEADVRIVLRDNIIRNNYAEVNMIISYDNLLIKNNTFYNNTCEYDGIYICWKKENSSKGLIENNIIEYNNGPLYFIDITDGTVDIKTNIYRNNNFSFISNNANALLESNFLDNNTHEDSIINNHIGYLYHPDTDITEVFVGNMTLKSNVITDNSVGRGVILNGANMIMESNIIVDNHAENQGGAVNNMGNLTMINNIIQNNEAAYGGAIYNLENINATNNSFVENNADYGGGIYNFGNISLNNNTFENNDADSGKVIENMVGATAEFEDNTIIDDNIIADENTSNYADNFEVNDKTLKTADNGNSNGIISNLDDVDFNEITSTSRQNPLVVNDPKRGITYLLKNYGNIVLKNSNFTSIIEDPNNNLYNSPGNITLINNTYMDKKLETRIVTENVKSRIGDNITLTARVVDENNNRVQSGSVIFKVNGLTLKSDKVFGSNATTLTVNVTNGLAEVNITSYLFLRNAKNLTAKYLGNNIYNTSTTDKSSPMAIQLR